MSIIDDKEIYEYDELFKCSCDGHYLRVSKFNGEPYIYLGKYSCNTLTPSFVTRVMLAVKYIFKPEIYDIHDVVLLEEVDAKKLGRDLLKISQPKPMNFFTGENE